MQTLTLILVALILAAVVALLLSYVYPAVIWLSRRNYSHTGVKVMRKQFYVDTETGEVFERWSTVRGIRHDLISAFVRF